LTKKVRRKKMAVINTNVKALFSQMALKSSGLEQSKAMQQLSTGKRINSARDDAAGLSIATRMTHQIRSLNQAVRNAGDAINLIQTAEGATNEITDMMQRMRELAVQAVNDTNNNADRSYLDLEFQQLKQQIVQIADNTEWNGFPVLNGKAGEQVGEMPVYKVTSENQFGSVFIDPTTTRTITGDDAGEIQTINFSGTPEDGFVTIAGIKSEINSTMTLSEAVDEMVTTLNNSDYFALRGITAEKVDGSGVGDYAVQLNFSPSEGDVTDVSVSVSGANILADDPVVAQYAATQAVESFASNGKFLQSGELRITVPSTAVVGDDLTALFVNEDGSEVELAVTLSDDNPATIEILKDSGKNSSVISADLTYVMKNSEGTGLDVSTAGRDLSLSIGVEGSVPRMRDGDLYINGINIGPSNSEDDVLSPRNNASGSAIAKAAAINRKAVDQGITQGESQSITFSGTPGPGTITVGGVSVVLTSDDSTPTLAAAKIAAAMKSSPLFDESSGRKIVYATGSASISVEFPVKEGNVSKIEVVPGQTGVGSVVNTTSEYLTKLPGTGVFAKVNENIVNGQAMTGGPVVGGVVFINGYASAQITTIYNNAQATRENVARAINMISDKTGVRAIDTGSDHKGITLVAADGRNVEVRFEPDSSTSAIMFGQRVGMREGVQSSTISLESKIQAPVVLSSDSNMDISRVGLVEGNFSKNEAVLNTKAREAVGAAVAQVYSLNLSGAVTDDEITVTINGVPFTATATEDGNQNLRDLLIAEITGDVANYATLGVTVSAGRNAGELLVTAKNPGTPFTMSAVPSSDASVAAVAEENVANQAAQFKALGADDLEINGIKIRPTTVKDDKLSYTGVSSSNAASSGIALAAAINASTNLTGVKAEANPVVSEGGSTYTTLPESGKQHLYVNGVDIEVDFTKGEPEDARRDKVVTAINQRTGTHGVTAINNGRGVTLTTDGRNLSTWFDSSVENLSAASFGLDKGGSVAQISKIKVGGTANAGDVAKVVINGVEIEAVTGADAAASAAALYEAIGLQIGDSNNALKNLQVSYTDGDEYVLIESTVAGSGFDLRGASVLDGAAPSGVTLDLSTVSSNSSGSNDVSAVNLNAEYKRVVLGNSNAALSVMDIKTLYSNVKLTSSAPILPAMPGPDGLKPNLMNIDGKPIQIRAGTDGFGALSNFSTLGFAEGSFGGRASEDMDPPRVGRMAFQVGSSANQVITIDLADFGKNGSITGEITGDVDLKEEDRRVRINTRQGATEVLNLLDTSMDKVNATRATMGAVMNRLDHVINNLTNVSMNMSASRSSIEDADYAQASTELAKTQIMQQAATAVLAQANTSQQSVMKLLGG
jgi:flagellin